MIFRIPAKDISSEFCNPEASTKNGSILGGDKEKSALRDQPPDLILTVIPANSIQAPPSDVSAFRSKPKTWFKSVMPEKLLQSILFWQ